MAEHLPQCVSPDGTPYYDVCVCHALRWCLRDATTTLRAEFLRLLTEDGPTNDARRKDFNQAIFAPEDKGGWAVWSSTDLDMVLSKFDKASKNVSRG